MKKNESMKLAKFASNELNSMSMVRGGQKDQTENMKGSKTSFDTSTTGADSDMADSSKQDDFSVYMD